ncbi:MAG: hypothetical protein EPN82_04510 [Bacteroidetes bacterium]|nr:MAG: hypothetical protein EPN82_04510 [Bacteroidota bacterium]
MKKTLTLLASVAALALVFSGCTTVYTGEEYYSYSPKHKTDNSREAESLFDDEEKNVDSTNDWQNPLANENQTVEVRHVYYDYSPMYVPVVVPWWYGYYGWMSYPYPRYWGSHFYIGFGYDPFYDWCWDWYSPWYTYHPYYGYYWPSYNYGWGHYGWFNQPYYAYDPSPAPRRNRDFGPRRGSEFDNNGNGNTSWGANRRGFQTASNEYSSGVRTINSTSGYGYNRRSAVSTNSGEGYSRGNNSSSGSTSYNRRDSRSTGSDVYGRGTENVYSSPNRSSGTVNRTIETVKGILNSRNSSSEGNSNSGSYNRRSNENSGSSTPTYNRSSEGSSRRSNNSSPSYTAPSRSSSPSYSAPSRSSSPGYSAPSRSSSGSSSGSSRSSGSSGSGSNSSSGRRGR